MNLESEQMLCKNCQSPLSGPYCNQCGQKVIAERFSMRRLFQDTIALVTNVEKGFWYTMKMLFLDPAKVVRDYLSGRTVCYYHPFRYLVILTTFSVLLLLSIGIFEEQQNTLQQAFTPEGASEEIIQRQKAINEEVKKYLNLISMLVVPFISMASFQVFKKHGFNFAEHLVMNTFLFGQATFFNTAFSLPAKLIPSFMTWAVPLGILGSSLYYAFFLRSFFKISYGRAVLQGFLIHFLGYLGMFVSLATIVFLVTLLVLTLK